MVVFCLGDIRLGGWSLCGEGEGEMYFTERVDV